ncbi:hypothetical protein RHOSPDRAFT_25720 [Rhodotorula sp. JG-1b]|nr:hypothetical protein RHOSPDRAFT_25720 [Rhodotorula sp. JG-1b]
MYLMLTITDCLTGYTRVASRRTTDSAIEIAEQVFEGWFTLFGLPEALHKKLGVKQFKVVLGYTPSLFPSNLLPTAVAAVEELVKERKDKVKEIQDALAAAKISRKSTLRDSGVPDPEYFKRPDTWTRTKSC